MLLLLLWLKRHKKLLSDIRENIQDVESDFVDVMEKVTEQKVQNIQNQDSRYTVKSAT